MHSYWMLCGSFEVQNRRHEEPDRRGWKDKTPKFPARLMTGRARGFAWNLCAESQGYACLPAEAGKP